MNLFSTSKKKIIICGYPKSGNTWLTRLIAEVVQCPVKGFWYEPENDEIAIEGSGRISEYECYKTHYRWNELQGSLSKYSVDNATIFYIVRDPRDVVVSVKEYFQFEKRYTKSSRLNRLLRKLNPFKERDDYDQVITYVLKGHENVEWLKVPWQEHIRDYLHRNVYIIKYEDLLVDAQSEVKKIADKLSLDISDDQIQKAIFNQSFQKKKERLMSEGKIDKANFLRTGDKNQWKNTLNKKQVERICKDTDPILTKLGYN
jgi:hypothetical protein